MIEAVMKRPILLLMLLATVAWGQAAKNEPKDDAKEAVAVVNQLFDAMRVKDAETK